ncbi:MAG TPA: C4-type zinc ribbon domain-containing protein [Nitrospirota bacterium]|nr:C4-type zinc ribbon domain-containing protein [Nitrospirota bacterium]
MDEQLSLLIQLQELDGALRTLMDRKKKLPESLEELDRRRAANTADLEKAKENLQTAQKNRRDRDKDLEAGAQKVEKLKSRTSDIKTNKEYQALLKEIEAAEQENKAIEDDILQLMEKIDAASASIGGAEERARREEAALQSEQKDIEAAAAKLENELQGVEQERRQFMERIQPAVLRQYQTLLASKAGVALAEARGETCSGCYMSIPPQVFVNVKKNESIITCPQCGRILYYKDAITQKGV